MFEKYVTLNRKNNALLHDLLKRLFTDVSEYKILIKLVQKLV